MAHRSLESILVTVGDEILGGFILDSNSHWLCTRLREHGFWARRVEVVGDREDDIVDAVRRALADRSAARVLVSGGLGPTPDDRTLAALGRALDRPLVEDPAALAHVQGIVDRMHAAGWVASAELSEANRRMTVVPAGAVVLHNRRGMAPALAYRLDPAGDGSARWLLALPGVPRELKAIVDEELLPRFFAGGAPLHVVEDRYPGAIEAELAPAMRVVETEFPDVAVGSYPQSEARELVIRARGSDPARVDAAMERVRELRRPPGR